MKNLKYVTSLAFLCLIQTSFAQQMMDLVRYSTLQYQSNARAMAVGNAFGSLGGNSLSSSINPAGLAAYSTSDFNFSLGFGKYSAESDYLNETYTDDKFNLNIPQLSLVLVEQDYNPNIPQKSKWLSKTFSMSFNRRSSHNKSFVFSGQNNQNSMLHRFSDELYYLYDNGYNIDSSSYGGLAYLGYLVDFVLDGDSNVLGTQPSVNDPDNMSVMQRQSINRRGHVSDLNFSFAANYDGKILVGGTLGIPVVAFTEKSYYTETNNNQANDNYNSMSLQQEIHDLGAGVFGQIGVILKPIHEINIGASVRTPTFYSIQRTQETWLDTKTDEKNKNLHPRVNEYSYKMISPWISTLSFSALLKERGFISLDYTYYNMAEGSFRGEGTTGDLEYFDENQEIEQSLNAVHQFNIGAEFIYGPFAFRAGHSLSNQIFKDGYMPDKNMYLANTYSGGIGYREAQFYVDIAYQTKSFDTFFQPYSLADQDVHGATNKERQSQVVLTLGFNF